MALLLYNFKYKYKNYIRLRSNELSMKQNYRTNLTGNAVAHFDLSSSTHTHTGRARRTDLIGGSHLFLSNSIEP